MKKYLILIAFLGFFPLISHAQMVCAPGDLFNFTDGSRCPVATTATDTVSLLAQIQSLNAIIADLRSQLANQTNPNYISDLQASNNTARASEIVSEIADLDKQINLLQSRKDQCQQSSGCPSQQDVDDRTKPLKAKKLTLQTEYATVTGKLEFLPQ